MSVAGWEVDFLWRAERLAVEIDGYASHSTPRAFERDHSKALDLQRAGLTLIRLSANQLRDRPDDGRPLLAQLLAKADGGDVGQATPVR